jgi:hypothetical protein
MGTEQSLLGPDFKVALSNCRIVVVGAKSGDKALLALSNLPAEARIVGTGNNLDELRQDGNNYSEVGQALFSFTGILFPFLCLFYIENL